MMDRRTFVAGCSGAIVIGLAFTPWNDAYAANESDKKTKSSTKTEDLAMPHVLPPLPYDYNALEPHIDEKTMTLHHDIHHQSYVTGLNNAEQKLQEAREKGDYALVKHWSRECAFHGSGHFLHAIFWQNMSPKGGGQPSGDLAKAMDGSFGGFDKFSSQFQAAANAVEGSGWAILAYQPQVNNLVILQAEKHQNLTQWGVVPLLVLDVWEHAYYLKYQNKRPEYTKAFMNVINWNDVAQRYSAAAASTK